MKKLFALVLCMVVSASLFAATFKAGQKLYVSKDATLKNDASKRIGSLEKGEVVIVVESDKKKSKITVEDNSSVSGWIENKYLTKKKVVKSHSGKKVTAVADEIALSGKASVSSKSLENADATVDGMAPVSEAEADKKVEEVAPPASEAAPAN